MFVAELLYNGASCLISLTLESSITGLHDGLVLLQVPELRTICKEFNMPASLTGKPKPVMVDSIVKYCKQHRPIFGSAGNLQGTILKRFKQKSNKYTLIPVFCLYFCDSFSLQSEGTLGSLCEGVPSGC